jgi:hypothetical protein
MSKVEGRFVFKIEGEVVVVFPITMKCQVTLSFSIDFFLDCLLPHKSVEN